MTKGRVHATLPAQDLTRARKFYEEKLGFKPVDEGPAGIWYESEGTRFLLFPSGGKASGTHTQIGIRVDDIEETIQKLQGKGVEFEEYNTPQLKTTNGIAEMAPGNKSAWFRDSEGNMIAVIQMSEVAAATR
jgi:catechol 2,3-dioxygenase-like lactoylglutathione lyase family enzyme